MKIVTATCSFVITEFSEEQVVDSALTRTAPLGPERGHLIVTPNMHHLALLEQSAALGEAYRRATMRLADGWPVVKLANKLGGKLFTRTTGSGIVEKLADSDGTGKRMFIVGGSTYDVTSTAAQLFSERGWTVGWNNAPQESFARTITEEALRQEVIEFSPDLVLLAVGAPKQEILGLQLLERGINAVLVCVGAGLDFLVGEVKRAPAWMQKLNLEFLHRILSEPTRLIGRYLSDVVPYLSVKWRSLQACRATAGTQQK